MLSKNNLTIVFLMSLCAGVLLTVFSSFPTLNRTSKIASFSSDYVNNPSTNSNADISESSEYIVIPEVDESDYTRTELVTKAGNVITITITDIEDERVIVLGEEFVGYSLEWDSGMFSYSWDGINYQEPMVIEDHAKDSESKQNISELLFDNNGSNTISIKPEKLIGLKLVLVKPADQASSNDSQITYTSSSYSGAMVTNLPIVSRADWGADENLSFWDPTYIKPDRIVIHHTVNDNSSSDYPAIVRSIFLYHTVSRNWGDIGYNYLIDQNGVIYEGRRGGDGVVGAHTLGANYESVGIAMIGTFTDSIPSEAALTSLENLIAEKSALHGFESIWRTTLQGHRDYQITQCPGEQFYNHLPTLQSSINLKIHNNGSIRSATAEAELVFSQTPAFSDLIVTFDRPTNVDEQELLNLLPVDSSIEQVLVTGNVATIRIKRYFDDNDNELFFRLKYLYTYFKLHPEVLSVNAGSYVI